MREARVEYRKNYMQSAYDDHIAGKFDPDDVYQIDEKTFFSFGDNLLYTMSETGKRVALIHMMGLLLPWHYLTIASQIQAAEQDAYVGALALSDCPGGTVKGMRKLKNAFESYSKPIGVHVSGNLNSAAAYVTSPANFIYADPNEKNSFGSIGVFTIRENISKKLELEGIEVAVIRSEGSDLKFKPNEFEPWTIEELASIQDAVNEDAENFKQAMMTGRGLDEKIIKEVSRGQEFDTKSAFANKLHDGTATLDEAVEAVATYKNQLFI